MPIIAQPFVYMGLKGLRCFCMNCGMDFDAGGRIEMVTENTSGIFVEEAGGGGRIIPREGTKRKRKRRWRLL